MIRDIPRFEIGFVTDGSGRPVDDTAIAYSDDCGIERELELKGEGAIDLMPHIVQAANSYDDMSAALRELDAIFDFGDMDEDGAADWAQRLGMADGATELLAAFRSAYAAIAKAEGR
ncbi:hypothetical protein ACQKQD_18255 [Methylobacterium sp. NPDC080182]|uniref:hypothetical protein n=1 Tax=Methylobacterium sp. NPDC080182 TaxID=3390590 RepID=UPI003D041096